MVAAAADLLGRSRAASPPESEAVSHESGAMERILGRRNGRA
jgi:hypothetical protein